MNRGDDLLTDYLTLSLGARDRHTRNTSNDGEATSLLRIDAELFQQFARKFNLFNLHISLS